MTFSHLDDGGLLNHPSQCNEQWKCVCELAVGDRPDATDGYGGKELPDGIKKDTLWSCYAQELTSQTEGFQSYEFHHGTTFDYADAKNNGERRFHSYKAAVDLAGIRGFRAKPPACVLALVEKKFGVSKTGYVPEENPCQCKVCLKYAQEQSDPTDDPTPAPTPSPNPKKKSKYDGAFCWSPASD